MEYAIVFTLGVIFGAIISNVIRMNKRAGSIIVTSDEDGTYLSLELKRLEDVTTNKEVTFGVVTRK